MQKEAYEELALEIVIFDCEDVITDSDPYDEGEA